MGELDDIVIDAAKVAIDGPAGAGARVLTTCAAAVRRLSIYGIREFDEAESAPGGFFEDLEGFAETIMHEMGHVLHQPLVLGPSASWRATPLPLQMSVWTPRFLGSAGNPPG